MVRVLMLNYEYPPLGGGTAVANEYLLKEFAKQPNLKLDLVTSSADIYRQEQFSKNINIYRLNIGKKNKRLHQQTMINLISYFIHSTIFTLKHKNDYDLIHAFSGLPGSITAYLSGLPYIISFRGAEESGYESRRDLLLKIIKPILALIYSRAKKLDANSQYLKNLVLKSFPGLKIDVINNGVDSRIFYPAKRWPLQPVIFCSSRMGERKGVKYLIQAMPQVLIKFPQAKLILVGEGSEKDKIKQLVKNLKISSSVIFKGRLNHQQLAKLYRNSRLFVLPSLSESQSNALLEAIASGLPIVATDIGGNPELVTKTNGLLVPPADSQAITEAILKALGRSWPKIRLGQKFSWKQTAKKYFQLYSRSNNF